MSAITGVFVRAGTSNGLFLHDADLPLAGYERDTLLLRQFQDGESTESLDTDGTKAFDLHLPPDGVPPAAIAELHVAKLGIAALRTLSLLARIVLHSQIGAASTAVAQPQ